MKWILIIGMMSVITACGELKPLDERMMEPMDQDLMNHTMDERVLAGTTAKYLEFSQEKYEKALAENKVIVLNFYADWCSICQREKSHVYAAFNELNEPNVIGFQVNYKDSNTDADEEALAEKYGITYQHTKIILKNGQQVAKSLDAWNKQKYLDEIGKV